MSTIDRPSDDILHEVTRIYEAKKCKNALKPGEFANLIVRIGDLIAHMVETNMLPFEDAEEACAHIPKYLDGKYSGITAAINTFSESINIAAATTYGDSWKVKAKN